MQLSICGSSAYASDRAVFPAAVNKSEDLARCSLFVEKEFRFINIRLNTEYEYTIEIIFVI
jgi:hypothetical protein